MSEYEEGMAKIFTSILSSSMETKTMLVSQSQRPSPPSFLRLNSVGEEHPDQAITPRPSPKAKSGLFETLAKNSNPLRQVNMDRQMKLSPSISQSMCTRDHNINMDPVYTPPKLCSEVRDTCLDSLHPFKVVKERHKMTEERSHNSFASKPTACISSGLIPAMMNSLHISVHSTAGKVSKGENSFIDKITEVQKMDCQGQDEQVKSPNLHESGIPVTVHNDRCKHASSDQHICDTDLIEKKTTVNASKSPKVSKHLRNVNSAKTHVVNTTYESYSVKKYNLAKYRKLKTRPSCKKRRRQYLQKEPTAPCRNIKTTKAHSADVYTSQSYKYRSKDPSDDSSDCSDSSFIFFVSAADISDSSNDDSDDIEFSHESHSLFCADFSDEESSLFGTFQVDVLCRIQSSDSVESDVSDEVRSANLTWNRNYERVDVEESKPHKVHFAPSSRLESVDYMEEFPEEYAQARLGPWEQMARDRARFQRRIHDVESVLIPCLQWNHREAVYVRTHSEAPR